ncbi:MAG TPA: hypothetical protein VNG71_09535 [Pyrinomonadaceae bacterium]|nr:hypothetical protein [Pyrinomonadaceae bacterium]
MTERTKPMLDWSLSQLLAAAASLTLLMLFLIHFSAVRHNAVNLPQGDEWGLLETDNHPASLDLPWLYGQVNDHRTATTKLLVWGQYQIDGWNVHNQLVINFLIYMATLILLIILMKGLAFEVPVWVIMGFVAFQLSPIIWPDHMMAYAVAVHFWLLFFLIAAGGLFSTSQSWLSLGLATIAAIVSAYSFASGVLTSGALLIFFATFKMERFMKGQQRQERRRELIQMVSVIAVVGGSLVGWVVRYRHPGYLTHYAWPYQIEFWSVFLNLVSVSFGVDSLSRRLGFVCLLLVVIPVVWEAWKRRLSLTPRQWASFAMVAAILVDLAAVATGRAFLGVGWSKVGEYSEHGMPLMVLSAINWASLFRPHRFLKWAAVGALWIFCAVAFADNWNFGIYDWSGERRMADYRCVQKYYEGTGDGHCGTFGDHPRPEIFLEQAKRLNISFYAEMSNEIRVRQRDGLSK